MAERDPINHITGKSNKLKFELVTSKQIAEWEVSTGRPSLYSLFNPNASNSGSNNPEIIKLKEIQREFPEGHMVRTSEGFFGIVMAVEEKEGGNIILTIAHLEKQESGRFRGDQGNITIIPEEFDAKTFKVTNEYGVDPEKKANTDTEIRRVLMAEAIRFDTQIDSQKKVVDLLSLETKYPTDSIILIPATPTTPPKKVLILAYGRPGDEAFTAKEIDVEGNISPALVSLKYLWSGSASVLARNIDPFDEIQLKKWLTPDSGNASEIDVQIGEFVAVDQIEAEEDGETILIDSESEFDPTTPIQEVRLSQ